MKSINYKSVVSTLKYTLHTDMLNILPKLFIYLGIFIYLFHFFYFALHKKPLQICNTFLYVCNIAWNTTNVL